MDQLRIKTYTPDSSTYSPRIRNEQWNQHKSLLKHLHDEGFKRAAMLDVLRKQGFSPSMGQLNAKMTAWGFKVYGTQSDLQDQGSDMSPPYLLEPVDTDMADFADADPTLSPTSRRSISSTTLCEPERQWTPNSDRNFALDEVIILQSLSLAGSYWPAVRPLDFGLRSSIDGAGFDELYYRSVVSVADFLCAVHCFEQAFDLYYHVFEHLVARDAAKDASLVRGLVQCGISATTDAQCAYVLSIIRRAHSYCSDHVMVELTSCFASLSHDLCTRDFENNNLLRNSPDSSINCIPLFIATNTQAKSAGWHKEWLQEELLGCDRTCSTLAHLSHWCQDTFSFYRIENHPIWSHFNKSTIGENHEMIAFEYSFQNLASKLIIDYLNSPGPSMKRANVECKEKECLYRSSLSPSTSLVVMAHLLHEPTRLQFHSTTNRYLQTRAHQLAASQFTTASQELGSFAAASSETRCDAFIDTFITHFSTTLAFRRFTATVDTIWDRMTAAKRLAQVLQSNQAGLLPHAGLPSARRSVLKTMVAPFGHDPILTESRPSIVSDSGSMQEFQRLASQIGTAGERTGSMTPSDAMSIGTRSSWSFHQVTGFSHVPLSARNSLSSRRGDPDEVDEYRRLIKDSNYSPKDLPSGSKDNTTDPKTPTPRSANLVMKDR